MIKIVMDSGGDLPAAWLAEYDVSVVPINIHFGTQVYQEGVDMDAATFYRRVDAENRIPQTAQPSPHQFVRVYRQIANDTGATDIISVNITSQLSGTHASSMIAAQDLAGEVRVHPFDSRSGSAGQGLMVLEAARLAAASVSVETIMERLRLMREHMSIYLALENLKFAQMSGRVSAMAATLSSMLRIKPLIVVKDGMMEVAERVRTQKRTIDRMVSLMKEKLGDRLVEMAVVHAEAPELAAELLARVQSEFNVKEFFVENLSLGIAVHLGPGTIGLVACPVD